MGLNYFSVFTIVSIYAPYLQVYLRQSGRNVNEVGYILAVTQASAVAGPLLFGALANRGFPLKPLIAAISLTMAVFLFSAQYLTGFLPNFILFAFVGLCFSALIPFTETIANGTLEDPERQYGLARFFGTLGFLVPTFGYSLFGFPAVFPAEYILYAGIGLTLFHLLTSIAYPSYAPKSPLHIHKEGSLGPVFWVVILLTFLNRFAMNAHYSFFSLYLDEVLGIGTVGWFWLVGPMMETPVLLFGGWFLSRFSIPTLLFVSGIAIAIRLSVYALFPSAFAVFAVQFLHWGTFGCFYIAVIAAIRRSVPRNSLTLAMALFAALGMGLGPIAGSSLGGLVIARWGYSALYLSSAVIALAGGLLSLTFKQLFAVKTAIR